MQTEETPPAGGNPLGIVLRDGVGMSETVGELFAALSAVQAKCRAAEKNAKNPHLRNSYADLASVLRAGREHLGAAGLSLVQMPTVRRDAAGVVYVLGHTSGEWMGGVLLHELGQGKGLSPAQRDGVCISYARRYVYQSVLGFASGDDTDGADQLEDQPRRPPARQATSATDRRAPAPKKPEAPKHHPSFSADRVPFCTALGKVAGGYTAIADACERRGMGRPSSWSQADRDAFLRDWRLLTETQKADAAKGRWPRSMGGDA